MHFGHTRTRRRGGAVQAVLDERTYQKGRKADDEIFNALNLTFHGEWNYMIRPQPKS